MRARAGLVAVLLLGSGLPACRAAAPPAADAALPAWLVALIASLDRQPLAGPPRAIYRATYQGQPVYYLTPGCCDTPGVLYTERGDYLCAPSGGFLGIGDGRCPDFLDTGAQEPPVWRQAR